MGYTGKYLLFRVRHVATVVIQPVKDAAGDMVKS